MKQSAPADNALEIRKLPAPPHTATFINRFIQ